MTNLIFLLSFLGSGHRAYVLNSQRFLQLLLLVAGIALLGQAHAHKFKDEARVFFIAPADGDHVINPVLLRFGAKRIPVAPVGVNKHRSGHFILLIDHAHPTAWDQVIAMDHQHIHYVEGETEAEIELLPGEHTLQLVLGDEEHVPWDEQLVSERITITVTGNSTGND
jgi:hypothetical protein